MSHFYAPVRPHPAIPEREGGRVGLRWPAPSFALQYQTGPLMGRQYTSLVDCAKTMMKEEGVMVSSLCSVEFGCDFLWGVAGCRDEPDCDSRRQRPEVGWTMFISFNPKVPGNSGNDRKLCSRRAPQRGTTTTLCPRIDCYHI